MKSHRLISLLLLLWIPIASILAQLTIKVTDVPDNTPATASIYIAGTVNNWDPGNANYILTNNNDGAYEITLNIPAGTIEFKFTRGSWPTVEGNANGGFLPNRTLTYNGGQQLAQLTIQSWEDLGTGGGTTEENVSILSYDFYMPQLDRYRRVWLYLPPDYDDSGKRYPVLYMHDGQNVFDPSTSFAGEWEVDESLNELFNNGDDGVIVVAIDNGGANRINEYSPWVNPQYGGGQGDEYAEFIVETLKPYIDEHYRTLTDRHNTGIMGSSLGALISMYAAIEYQEVFGKAGIFSPAFWFAPECYTQVTTTGKEQDMKFYLLAGQLEGNGSVVTDLNNMRTTLLNAGFTNNEIFYITHSDGQHSEWYWAREFPDAYEWLYADAVAVSVGEPGKPLLITLSPNPADSMLQVNSSRPLVSPKVAIYAANGRLVLPPTPFTGTSFGIDFLSPGAYIFEIQEKGKVVATQKVVVR